MQHIWWDLRGILEAIGDHRGDIGTLGTIGILGDLVGHIEANQSARE